MSRRNPKMPRDRQHRPDEEVLSTRAAAEAHRLLDMCRKNGIVQAAGSGRKLTLRPWAAAIALERDESATLEVVAKQFYCAQPAIRLVQKHIEMLRRDGFLPGRGISRQAPQCVLNPNST
jgi:hypothetical protein